MIATVVVGHGLAGRAFHCPLIRRQPGLEAARDRRPRSPRCAPRPWRSGATDVRGYADLDEALADPAVELVVIATPHDTPRRSGRADARCVASTAWSTR